MKADGTTSPYPWSWRRETPMLVILAGLWIASAVSWPLVDEPIPIHWDASGEVDRTGGKAEGLLMLPGITTGVYLLLAFLPRIDPARANYGLFAGTYSLIRFGTTAFLALVHGVVLATAFGADVDIALVLPVGLAGLFLLLGNAMGKVRPNYFAGVRTPWTLASVKSWNATHRVAGWVFMVAGVLFLGGLVIRESWYVPAVLAVLGAAMVLVAGYSWWVWRSDPDRIPATMSHPAEE